MCFTDLEPCDVAISKHRKARKTHKCSECGRTIWKSERYLFISGISEDGPFTHKECRNCQYDRQRVIQRELEEGCFVDESDPGMGGLMDALRELDMSPTFVLPTGE